MRIITNEEFLACKKKYNHILKFAIYKYNSIEYQELKQLIYIGLWRAMVKFDNKKATFTTYLTRMVNWTILSHLKRYKKLITSSLRGVRRPKELSIILVDLLDGFTDEEKTLFTERFLNKTSIRDIAEKQNSNSSKVTKQIYQLKKKLHKNK